MEEEEYDPYLVAFDNIKTEENILYKNNIIQEDENMIKEHDNNNLENENVEMKNENNLDGASSNLINESENNLLNKNNENIMNNENNINNELNENSKDINSKINESKNKINVILPSKMNNEENKKMQEYEYGYNIMFLNEGESGIMEDFINDKNDESTLEDYFNFNFDDKKWIKFLNHSILVHYEKNMKEYLEKQKKMKQFQSMYSNNQAVNTPFVFTMNPMNPMNPFFINQFKNMNMPNIKNVPINSNK